MQAQIALRGVAAPAPHVINLLVASGNALDARAYTAAIGSGTDSADLQPVIAAVLAALFGFR